MFATASEKGTLIRVFSIAEKKLIKELRRGTNECQVLSLSFSQDNSKIACTSDHGTLHVFSLKTKGDDENVVENKRSNLKFLGGVSKYFDSEWSYAKFSTGCNSSICRFVSNDKIVVLGADASYYRLRLQNEDIIKESSENLLKEK